MRPDRRRHLPTPDEQHRSPAQTRFDRSRRLSDAAPCEAAPRNRPLDLDELDSASWFRDAPACLSNCVEMHLDCLADELSSLGFGSRPRRRSREGPERKRNSSEDSSHRRRCISFGSPVLDPCLPQDTAPRSGLEIHCRTASHGHQARSRWMNELPVASARTHNDPPLVGEQLERVTRPSAQADAGTRQLPAAYSRVHYPSLARLATIARISAP